MLVSFGFKLGHSDDFLAKWLEDNVYPKKSKDDKLVIPKKSDGRTYDLQDCAEDQKKVLCAILESVRSFVRCDKPATTSYENRMLRLTVSGVAGSGKSTLTNTLVSTVRKMFGYNSSALVFGPTGTSAFNAGGETTHRGWGLPKKYQSTNVSADKMKKLHKKFSRTVVIVIDERSMIEACNLGAMESYLRQSLQGGFHQQQPWGGMPIVALVGDDYQLPSVNPGAFYCFADYVPKGLNNSAATSHFTELGLQEFKKIGEKTVFLENSKRTNKDQNEFLQIQKELRCEGDDVGLCESSMSRLMSLHVNNFDEKDNK